jgi:nucleotide-binding universal stress UspA family protein
VHFRQTKRRTIGHCEIRWGMKTTVHVTKRRRQNHIADVTQPLAQPNPRNANPGRASGNAVLVEHCKTSPGRREGIRVGFKKILVPVDFSKESKSAVQYAVNLALQFRASVYLLHAIETVDYSVDCGYGPMIHHISNKELGCKAMAKLKVLAKKLGKPCRSNEPILLNGAPEEMIVQAAKSLSIDLIVMPTHDHTPPECTSRKSIAEHTIHHAPCPVLIVRG